MVKSKECKRKKSNNNDFEGELNANAIKCITLTKRVIIKAELDCSAHPAFHEITKT